MLRLEFLGWCASIFFFSLSELGPVRKEPEERGKINSPHLAGPDCLCAIKGGHMPSPRDSEQLNSSYEAPFLGLVLGCEKEA